MRAVVYSRSLSLRHVDISKCTVRDKERAVQTFISLWYIPSDRAKFMHYDRKFSVSNVRFTFFDCNRPIKRLFYRLPSTVSKL